MRLGSLCSGYGGLELGIAQVLDIETVWCSEIDKDASKVLATHHPGVPNLGDLTVLDWAEVEPVDIMCAGFPCQPFSHAGKRQGEHDERAIFQYIADGVAAIRPRWVVLENVPGILTLGGASVVGTLAELGYDCRWTVVRASDTGAPHKRARWFCVAESADASDFGHERAGGSRRRGVGSTNGSGAAADADEPGGEAWGDTGHPRERIRQQPVGSAAPAADAGGMGWGEGTGQFRQPTPTQRGERNNESSRGAGTTHDFGPYGGAVERWEHVLGRRAPVPVDDRGLNPWFVEWMLGLPEGWVCDLGLSRTAMLKMLGNGVVPQQAALAVELLL